MSNRAERRRQQKVGHSLALAVRRARQFGHGAEAVYKAQNAGVITKQEAAFMLSMDPARHEKRGRLWAWLVSCFTWIRGCFRKSAT